MGFSVASAGVFFPPFPGYHLNFPLQSQNLTLHILCPDGVTAVPGAPPARKFQTS